MIHIVRFELDTARLRAYELLNYQVKDLAYRTHCAVEALFPGKMIRPYHVLKEGAGYRPIIGYSRVSADELQERVDLTEDPAIYNLLRPGTLQGKPMPSLKAGKRVGFEIRVQPTVRQRDCSPEDLDAYLFAFNQVGAHKVGPSCFCDHEGKMVYRDMVYADWLRKFLGSRATIEDFLLKRHEVTRQVRQTRVGRVVEPRLPDATFSGILEVQDETAFIDLLATGIGRGKGFGFGMMRLRPP